MAPSRERRTDLALGDHEGVAERGEQVVQLLVAEAVVERDERHAGGGGREQPDREGEAVGADVGQRGGAPRGVGARPGGGQQLGGGEPVVAGLHDDLVAAAGRDHVEEEEQVHAA